MVGRGKGGVAAEAAGGHGEPHTGEPSPQSGKLGSWERKAANGRGWSAMLAVSRGPWAVVEQGEGEAGMAGFTKRVRAMSW